MSASASPLRARCCFNFGGKFSPIPGNLRSSRSCFSIDPAHVHLSIGQGATRSKAAGIGFEDCVLCFDNGLALRSAMNSKYLAQKTQFEFWADFQVSLALTVLGKHDEAKTASVRASALPPSFCPPSRYLIGLSALEGDFQTAQFYSERLTEEEPGFDPLQLTDDDQYPAGFLRRLSIVQKDKIKGLAMEL